MGNTTWMIGMREIEIKIPLKTAVIKQHQEMVTGTEFKDETSGIFIDMHVKKINWRKKLSLPKHTKIQFADVRTVEIKELSAMFCPITYRLTIGDGYYRNQEGVRQYFALQPHLRGIDLTRRCTVVTMRAAILLTVLGGVGLRMVSYLFRELFHVDVSKSTLDRWVKTGAETLPDRDGMLNQLHALKPIHEAHFDEIFRKGSKKKRCTLVLRDEHGRLFYAKEIKERTAEAVSEVLEQIKGLGVNLTTFYVDGCEAYRKAIGEVYPDAVVQYDYFHVIQGIWRKLRKGLVLHRRSLKEKSKAVKTNAYGAKLEAMAKELWEHRGLIFKNPDRLSREEKQTLTDLMEKDRTVVTMRHFMGSVWGIFRDSASECGARQRLLRLKKSSSVVNDRSGFFIKSVAFLEGRFDDMIAFLCHPNVQRNSLAETSVRALRRLERGHDGFRSEAGFDAYFRLYQVIKYLDFQVHRALCDGVMSVSHPLTTHQTGPPPETSLRVCTTI